MAKNRKTPDMNLPVWFDGQNINEALFCEEFLQERRIIFTNRAFFTPNGRVTDDIVLRGEVYEKLKNYTISSVLMEWIIDFFGSKPFSHLLLTYVITKGFDTIGEIPKNIYNNAKQNTTLAEKLVECLQSSLNDACNKLDSVYTR